MSGMTLVDIEVSAELEEVVVGRGHEGLAVVVRRQGRPIGFWMEDLPAGFVLSRDDMSRRIAHHAGPIALFDRLCPPVESLETTPSLTVAICTKDRPVGLARCLASLQPIRTKARERGIDVDIVVVDNASIDPAVRTVAESHGARWVPEPRPGLDFARNRALDEAVGTWLAFFDDDVVVDPVWIDGWVDALGVHPDASAVTGLVLPFALDTGAQVLFERRGGFRHGLVPQRYGADHPVERTYPAGAGFFGTGANTAVRVDAAGAVGGFDEALDAGAPLPGGGDLDLYYRLVRAGHTIVYEPSCLAFHEHRRDTAALRRQFHASWGISFHAFIAKCWHEDPQMRPAHRRYVTRWYRTMGAELLRSVRASTAVPTSMLATEITGALRGTMGGYGRSRRRTDAIRRAHS